MMRLSDQKCLHVLVPRDIWNITEKRTERYSGLGYGEESVGVMVFAIMSTKMLQLLVQRERTKDMGVREVQKNCQSRIM